MKAFTIQISMLCAAVVLLSSCVTIRQGTV
ncbi:MAG: hypothetical protein ACJAQ4_002263, partial [Cryomorphaceae bacterium]